MKNRHLLAVLLAVLTVGAATGAFARESSEKQPSTRVAGLLPVVGRNEWHVVRPGETLYSIGVHYAQAIEHLMWANHLSGMTVNPGTKLLIPGRHVLPGMLSDGVIVNLPERGAYLFRHHTYEGFFPCAIGRGGRFATPTGDTRIICKVRNPTWTPPSWSEIKKPIPEGPDDPLGDRWIGLGFSGIGMHGTNEPMSVGEAVSHGCMRMYPSVVRRLFPRVAVGMPVRIVYEPIKIGFDPQTRQLFVQIFPDVYHRIPDLQEALEQKLQSAGLAGLISSKRIASIVAESSSVPRLLLEQDVVIKIDGRMLQSSLAPFVQGGRLWATGDLLRSLGADATYRDGVLTASLGGRQVRYEGDETGADAPAVVVSRVTADRRPAPPHRAAPSATGTSAPSAAATSVPSAAATSAPSAAATSHRSVAGRPVRAGTAKERETTLCGPVRVFQGRVIFPVRPVLNALGISSNWVGKYRTLLVSRPRAGKKPVASAEKAR